MMKYQGIESQEAIDDNAPLLRSDDATSSSQYESIQKPMDKPVLLKDFPGWIQNISKRTKILLGVMTVSTAALLLYLLLAPSNTRDHCVQRGHKTFEMPVIPFNTSGFAIFVGQNEDVWRGIIKVSQLSTNDNGAVYAHINTSPGDVADNIRHVVDIDERETRVTISLSGSYKSSACVYVEVEIQIPAYTASLAVIGNVEIVADKALTVDFVKMYSRDEPIRFLGGWQGRDLMLGTSNAGFDFGGNHSLHATGSIFLHTTNSWIRLDDSSSETITAVAYGGRVEMRNTTATAWIEANTYNGFVSLQDTRASNITIRAKEKGTIDLDHVTVDNTLIAETEHGAINAQLDGSQNITAMFETYDGNVNITMPDDFSGHFAVYSSSTADVVTISGNHQHVVIDKNLTWEKTGYTNKDGEGFMQLRALYSHVNIVF